jgi:hypothetical protein
MTPDDERTIEQYVRRPDALGAEDRRVVERLIAQDPGAAAYAEFLRGFYDRMNAESASAPSDRVEAFVEDLFQEEEKAVIPVQPFRPRREPRPTVLAADTAAPADERRFSVLTTLAAEAEDVLVRVVKDRDTGEGRLYVLAEPPERRAHVVVSFPDLGLDLVADEEGRLTFDLPTEIQPDQWADARAVVRRPVATRAVAPGGETTVPVPSGGTLLGSRAEGVLTVEIESGGPGSPTFLTATPLTGSASLLRLQASMPQLCEVPPEAPLVLRLYE